jgi:hypothetical protein
MSTLSPPLYRPFFLATDFFPSPEKSFELLVYAEPLAVAFAAEHITDPLALTKYLDPRVHELMDVEAYESNRSTSNVVYRDFVTVT